VLLEFADRGARGDTKDTQVAEELLKNMKQTNHMLTLNQIYMRRAFEYLRTSALSITQSYFRKLNTYYNMLFGLFVSFLTIFQIVVSLFLVKALSHQIVKMYHVVLLIPFSGRTQNDLNELMLI
jgi:hypothetical protein